MGIKPTWLPSSLPQTFDNGVICASEQSVVVVDQVGGCIVWLALESCNCRPVSGGA